MKGKRVNVIANHDGSEAREQALELCEVALSNGLRRQLEGGASVGAQLAKIRDGHLFLAAECKSFEQYYREVLEMGREAVDRFLAIAEVVDSIRAANLELPVGEHQAVLLAKIPREELISRWRTVLSFCVQEQVPLSDRTVRRAVEIARKQSSPPLPEHGWRASEKGSPRGGGGSGNGFLNYAFGTSAKNHYQSSVDRDAGTFGPGANTGVPVT